MTPCKCLGASHFVVQEQAVTPLIPQLSPRLLSQLLWSLSTLSLQPQQLLMLRILLQSGRLMHQANAQDCAQLIQGMAKLQQQPPESWMDEYWSRVSEVREAVVGTSSVSMSQLAFQQAVVVYTCSSSFFSPMSSRTGRQQCGKVVVFCCCNVGHL